MFGRTDAAAVRHVSPSATVSLSFTIMKLFPIDPLRPPVLYSHREVPLMIAAIIIYLLHGALFGHAARRVSEYRGESDGFWWGFWLGCLGLLIVIFRSSRQTEVRATQPGSGIRQSWRCSKCNALNPVGKGNCQSCGTSKEAGAPSKICLSCGAKNKAGNAACFACGHAFEN